VTIVAVCSLKGSPGATTLSSLIAAAWPVGDSSASGARAADPESGAVPVTLIEADPSGGDLAARFGLSSRLGWSSLRVASRRSDGPTALDPHLQHLPGGLPVLVGARGDERCGADSGEAQVACDGSEIVVVDLGRLTGGDAVTDSWLHRADQVVLVVRGDAASAVRVKERAVRALGTAAPRAALVVVGGDQPRAAFAKFTGFPVLAELPVDPPAAAVASGESSAGRRLERSLLWVAAARLASVLAVGASAGGDADTRPVPTSTPTSAPSSTHASPATTPAIPTTTPAIPTTTPAIPVDDRHPRASRSDENELGRAGA